MAGMSTNVHGWITVAEAAKRLACSPRTVLRLAESGAVRRIQVNRRFSLVKATDIEAERKREYTIGRPRGS